MSPPPESANPGPSQLPSGARNTYPLVFEDENLALGRPARQSSTYVGGDAFRAVDGDTSGDYYFGSVAHTHDEECPWWEVDLGRRETITAVDIWNRTDAYQSRLKYFRVFVSRNPLPTGTASAFSGLRDVWSSPVIHEVPQPKAKAATFYADVLPIIRERRADRATLEAIADELNAAGRVTGRGLPFTATAVHRLLRRE